MKKLLSFTNAKPVAISVATFVLTLAVTLISAQAQAGVATFFLFKNSGDCFGIGQMIAVYGGGTLALAGLITIFFNPIIGAGLIALGANSTPADMEAALANEFSTKYAFIEDRAVTASMAHAITVKTQSATEEMEAVQIDEQSFMVVKKEARLTESEVRALLAPADLTEAQIQVVAQDLK